MGSLLDRLEARAPRHEAARLVYGSFVALVLPLAWARLAGALERRVPWPLHALALKPVFAGRALLVAGRRVEAALHDGELEPARHELRSLVSRPTVDLDRPLVAAAAIESLADGGDCTLVGRGMWLTAALLVVVRAVTRG